MRRSDRQRLYAWMMVFLLLLGLVAVFVVHQVLLLSLEQRVRSQLQSETSAFRRIVTETGASSTEELGQALDRLLLRGAIAPQAAFVFADGDRIAGTGEDAFTVPGDVLADWAATEAPEQGVAAAPAGQVDYLALPIVEAASEGPTSGVFVVAVLTGPQREALRQAVSLVGVALLVVFAGASVVLWWVVHRVVSPATVPQADVEGEIQPQGEPVAADDAFPHLAEVPAPGDAAMTAGPAGASRRPERTATEARRAAAGALTDDPAGPTIDVTDDAVATPAGTDHIRRRHTAPARREGSPAVRRPPLAGDRVELGRVTVNAYSRVQRLADRDWVMDIPPDTVVRCDQVSLVDALVTVAADAAARTGPGDTIHIGAREDAGRAEVSVAVGSGAAATARPFAGDADRLTQVRTAIEAQGGELVVEGRGPAGVVRILLETA